MQNKIHIAADHAGYELKQELIKYLEQKDYEVVDHGAFEFDEEDDYPDFIFPAAKSVALDSQEGAKGVVIGGSGQGFLSLEEAKESVDTFLETDFSGDERHIRRLEKIEKMDF
jgi:ribose 5-phosphate isomerase RpiB